MEEEAVQASGVDVPAGSNGEEVPSFDRKRLIQALVVVVLLVVAVYVVGPKLVGVQDAFEKLGDANPLWIGAALLFSALTYFAYMALFRGVVAERIVHLEWAESYQITMAGLAASRLFAAGGAGGLVLTYWALRKAGMQRRQAVCRMVAFTVLLYTVYLLALILFGVLLRTGVLSGGGSVGLTIVPAVIAGFVLGLLLLVTLVPGDLERRMARASKGYRRVRLARRLATVPSTLATGTRTALAFLREPSRGGLALLGAVGFWAGNIAILWACFHGFGAEVPLGVVVQGYFIGMVANLISITPGGAGSLDAGMIGAYVLFDIPSSEVFASILGYRLIAFYLPVIPGVLAYFQLLRTTQRWQQEGREVFEETPAPALAQAFTSESKV